MMENYINNENIRRILKDFKKELIRIIELK